MADDNRNQTPRRRVDSNASQQRFSSRQTRRVQYSAYDQQESTRERRSRTSGTRAHSAQQHDTYQRTEQQRHAQIRAMQEQPRRASQSDQSNDSSSQRSASYRTPHASAPHRTGYTASHARKMSRRVNDHTLGSHVSRKSAQQGKNKSDINDTIRRRAHIRRIVAGIVAVVIVVGVAVGMGMLAFRGTVGSSMALKDSDATEALKSAAEGDPIYSLVTVELGAIADPLENPGPDCLVLVRVDNEKQTLALINIPPNLQVTVDNQTYAISTLALESDAKLIEALSSFIKLPISHFIKIDEEGFANIVDTLGGIDLDIEQVIDDPRAGDVYLPIGPYTLKGSTALMYMRADNLKMGTQDKMTHQLKLMSHLAQILFGDGGLSTKIDSISSYFQTDCALTDFELVASWFKGKKAGDVIIANLSGYTSAVSSINNEGQQRFISTYSDFESILKAIEEGRSPSLNNTEKVEAADPSSFKLDVQNGTSIPGLASVTADLLKEDGFVIGEVGNAEVQVYEETLVVYRNDEGLAEAKSVIEALGIGRAVNNSDYYKFESDVLLIIGSDYSPVN